VIFTLCYRRLMIMSEFKTTAEKDRHYICEIGRLLLGDAKQCYASDAVYRAVRSLIGKQGDAADGLTCGHEDRPWFHKGKPCPKCGIF